VYLLYASGYIGYNNYNFLLDVAALLPLSIAVFVYMRMYKRMSLQKIKSALGFVPKGIAANVAIGILIFLVILAFEIAVGLASAATNVPINTNADLVFAGAPMWFYIFAAVIEPINEEIMFRGFLVPRLGVILSALIFGVAHYSYYSTFGIEVIAAFIFGTMAGYVFKKKKSIYPGIVAHILVNSLAVLALIGGI
jgi:membrane protease YdiL (CAAX protease family)